MNLIKYLDKKAQTKKKDDLFYSIYHNGKLKNYVLYANKKEVIYLGINEEQNSGTFRVNTGSESYKENNIQYSTAWNDNEKPVKTNLGFDDWAIKCIKIINKKYKEIISQ